jgi:putative ABC transport system permease protein
VTALINRTIVAAVKGAVSIILRAYPRPFRDRFHAELSASIENDLVEGGETGTRGLFRAGAHAVADALKGVVPEHRAERLRSHRGATRGGGRGGIFFNGVLDDLKYALRSLGASRTFTAVAVVVLGLAIGAATAIFSIVDTIVLRGLPFDGSDRIVSVMEYVPNSGRSGSASTPQTFLDWKSHQQSFQQFAAVSRDSFRIRNERDEPATARAMKVTREFMALLRVSPMLGRPFTEADEVEGAHRVVILSYGFWKRQFSGAPGAVGQTLSLNGEKWEVVGVMPVGFSWPVGSQAAGEVFAPIAFRGDERVRARTRNFMYSVIGRLKDDVSIEQASEDMNRLAVAIDAENPQWNPGGRVRVVTLHEAIVERVRSWMVMLLGAVALVLLIACANVANLMLVRSTVRGRELGIRAALGASRWRIARALVAEGLVLSVVASAVGIALAWMAVRVLTAWLPSGLPRVASISIDYRILAAAAAAALLTGVAFGLAPALQSSRVDLTLAFRDGRTSTAGAAGKRLRGLLVVAEVALAVVLLVGAGLFITSFVGMMRIQPGFDYRNVLSVYVNLPFERGDDFKKALERGTPYVQRMLDAVSHVPGVVQAASISGGLPLSGSWQSNPFSIPGGRQLPPVEKEIQTRWISPGYLAVLRIPLLRGRALTAEDRPGAPQVVLVNEAAAQRYWPDRDALGQRIIIEDRDMTIVGIVGNIRHGGPESPVQPEAYVPLAQDGVLSAALLLRTEGDPLAILPAVKAAIWSVNREQRFTTDVFTLEGHMDRLIAQRRFNMALLAIFGVLGLVIAAAGIYGVMAYAVAQRTAEIGVRMALGASPRGVVAMVLGNAGALMAAGLAIGTAGAWYLSATVEKFLFRIEPTDPRVFAAALATLAAAGLLASALPARRAASVDPVVALRSN